MTAKLHILQHSLGLDQFGQGKSSRNHFATDPGCKDHQLCEELVHDGLMTVRRRPALFGGMDVFFVNDAGRDFVAEHSPRPPKLTRAQQRYQRWLDNDSDESFGDFLKRTGARAA